MKCRVVVLTVIMAAVMALGDADALAQRTADASPAIVRPYPRVMKCVVAGPRAALVFEPLPIVPVEPAPEDTVLNDGTEPEPEPVGRSIGDAFNFAREDKDVTMRWGQMLDVKLHDRIEGVWYEHAKGWLGTVLVLDIRRPDVDPADELTDNEDGWVTLGRDGASDFRAGPSIGRAECISVRFYPRRPGNYLLRARIYTYAMPFGPASDGADPPPPSRDEIREHGKIAADTVYIKVSVVYPTVDVEELPEPPEQGEIMPREDLSGVIL